MYKEIIKKEILNIIKNSIHDQITFNDNSVLNEIGIDSIKFVNMIVEIEDKYHFEFDDEMLARANFFDIQSLVEYVYEKCRKDCCEQVFSLSQYREVQDFEGGL